MIHYVTGDAAKPRKRPAMVVHCVNDIGLWGRGFTAALDKLWEGPGRQYKEMFAGERPMLLGQVSYCACKDDLFVVNMCAQHGVGRGKQRVDYDELRDCLDGVADFIKGDGGGWTVHMPRIGTGLRGGDWSVIETLVDHAFHGICDIYVYTLPQRRRGKASPNSNTPRVRYPR